MKTRTLLFANIVVFGIIAGIAAFLFLPLPQEKERHDKLPAFGMEGLAYTDLNDEVMILNVFSSWCPPCRAEHPLLLKLSKEHGIPLYGIAFQDTKENIDAYLEELGNPYKQVGMDYGGLLVKAVPETMILMKDHTIYWHVRGPLNEQVIHEQVLPLIEKLRNGTELQ
ncbi:MAG: redoxin domain-containing protein [Alphaproteobacteria bacterium]|nr:redoxin domain-containing protein [Alphaproteobacteria bacterium]